MRVGSMPVHQTTELSQTDAWPNAGYHISWAWLILIHDHDSRFSDQSSVDDACQSLSAHLLLPTYSMIGGGFSKAEYIAIAIGNCKFS